MHINHGWTLSTIRFKHYKACAETGVDYVDLCGEPAWMHQMIQEYNEIAKGSGARIVFSCGFDSIPFDLGVYLLQKSVTHQGNPAKMLGDESGL